MAIEIVDLPINSIMILIFHCFLYAYQRVTIMGILLSNLSVNSNQSFNHMSASFFRNRNPFNHHVTTIFLGPEGTPHCTPTTFDHWTMPRNIFSTARRGTKGSKVPFTAQKRVEATFLPRHINQNRDIKSTDLHYRYDYIIKWLIILYTWLSMIAILYKQKWLYYRQNDYIIYI